MNKTKIGIELISQKRKFIVKAKYVSNSRLVVTFYKQNGVLATY